MNTNWNTDQPTNTERHSAQRRVKASTFVGAAALSVALVAMATGWAAHKPTVLVKEETEATKTKVASKAVGTVRAERICGSTVRKSQKLVSLERLATLKQERETGGSMNASSEWLRGSVEQDICLQSNWWMHAKAVAEQAQGDVNRARELQAAGVISLQEYQASERDLNLAQGSERAARANVDLTVALCGEVKRLDAVAEHAAQRIAELEALVAELRSTSRIDDNAQDQILEQADR